MLVWKFRVRDGAESRFVEGYGAAGRWARLFGRAPGFKRTELARSVEHERCFYTLDYWESREAFEKFRAEYAAEYEALDREFEGLTESETFIGAVVQKEEE